MTQRLKTGKETLFYLVKLMYVILGLPCLVLLSVFGLIAVLGESRYSQGPSIVPFVVLIWSALVVPIAIFIYNVIRKRRLLKRLVPTLKDTRYFDPQPGYEIYHEGDGKYFGIDLIRGTMLYVHRIRKGEVDVLGLDMSSWTDREVEGNLLRLYTRIPELPKLQIGTPWAQRWFDTLGAMENRDYQTPTPYATFVAERYAQLEQANNIKIPRLA
ncbi:plasmid IncI1-type surface exclusion protein ExcA [Serratia marcescens]|uniref:plasmid IncI1-type surface exclusion protein ExcA n=1 Tax=Serratia marcescens TaxID=615 RepID=UPI00092C9599|nr:plasmid IncI1-type surface exclusion protein ExcA [Serratia marcescens]OJH81935.1 putative exclusion-determining protein [Serratia marcescens]